MAKKIYFRADADSQIGYGHFIRSLALADMLKDDFDCVFVTKNPTEYQRKQVNDICRLVELPEEDSCFDLFLNMLGGDEIVVLDNYFYTKEYQLKIKQKGVKLVCIDDFRNREIFCDVLINTSVSEMEQLPLVKAKYKLLGLSWSLLRKDFLIPISDKTESSLKRVVICFGGADELDLTRKALSVVLREQNVVHIDVVVGAIKNKDNYLVDDRVNVYQNIAASEMAKLLRMADYCIVSTSGVALEAIAVGCKAYTGYYVDNQKELYNNLVLNRYVYGLGDLREQQLSLGQYSQPLKKINLSNQRERYIDIFKQL